MRNILITGANGQLGNELRLMANRGTSGDRYIFTDVNEACEESRAMMDTLSGGAAADMSTRHLDITDITAIRRFVEENGISVIINCAAYTNVDAAEDNRALAELLNATAVGNLAQVMHETPGGILVHISTDYVFGAEPYNTPCREDQSGTPIGVYGETKLEGERAIRQAGCPHVIIRTAWLYSEFGKNFVKTMLHLTATRPELNVVFDQTGTPTYARDLAEFIFRIVDDRSMYVHQGIYHYSNEGVCSWYDFTKMIAEYAGNTACEIRPCHSDEFPSKVRRPSYSVLDKTKIKNDFGIRIPYWTDSLKTCIANLKNQ